MSVAIFTPTPDINKWQMSLCNNSSDIKSYWYMHKSQPSSHLLRINFTVHLELWPGNHFIWCKREREIFYLTTHSTHFIYGYMASDIWLRTILIVRKETRCRHIGYSFRLTARVHPTDRITHTTAFVIPVVEHWLEREIAQLVHHMKDRSDDPSHHERTLDPLSYIPLLHLVQCHLNQNISFLFLSWPTLRSGCMLKKKQILLTYALVITGNTKQRYLSVIVHAELKQHKEWNLFSIHDWQYWI